MNAHNMFVDVSVRAVINCSLRGTPITSWFVYNTIIIMLLCYTVYCLCCVTLLYFTATNINIAFIHVYFCEPRNSTRLACLHLDSCYNIGLFDSNHFNYL